MMHASSSRKPQKRREKKTRKTDNHYYAMFGNTAHFRVLSVLHTISSSKQIPVQKKKGKRRMERRDPIFFLFMLNFLRKDTN